MRSTILVRDKRSFEGQGRDLALSGLAPRVHRSFYTSPMQIVFLVSWCSSDVRGLDCIVRGLEKLALPITTEKIPRETLSSFGFPSFPGVERVYM